MAALTKMITRSLISRKSCCSSIVPDFGLEMTNSLSEESTRRSTSSSSSFPPSARSMSLAVEPIRSNSDSARSVLDLSRTLPFVLLASPAPTPDWPVPPRTSRVLLPPVRLTRTTVSNTAPSDPTVWLKDRPAPSPNTPAFAVVSASVNSFASAFSICAAIVFSNLTPPLPSFGRDSPSAPSLLASRTATITCGCGFGGSR
mmetsp:Transcript_9833/g.24283  ORF Transcript_9833/g.24283 Transcript_9833/m.24283 type:complete len:201 (+) Transcript_9833:1575-2177(+)